MLLTTLLADRGRHGDHDGEGFFFLLMLILLGVGIYFLIKAIRRRRGLDGHVPDARRVLDDRFARGDIDRAEYEHRKAVLEGADVIPPAPAPTPTPPPAPPAASTATAVAEPAVDTEPESASDTPEAGTDSSDDDRNS